MSFIDLFKKPQPKTHIQDIQKIIHLFKQATAKEVISFEACKEQGDLFDCKIGGNYLQPNNFLKFP